MLIINAAALDAGTATTSLTYAVHSTNIINILHARGGLNLHHGQEILIRLTHVFRRSSDAVRKASKRSALASQSSRWEFGEGCHASRIFRRVDHWDEDSAGIQQSQLMVRGLWGRSLLRSGIQRSLDDRHSRAWNPNNRRSIRARDGEHFIVHVGVVDVAYRG